MKSIKKNLSKLTSLKGIILKEMIRRLAKNGVTIEKIEEVYKSAPTASKEKEVIKLLRGEIEGKAQIIKKKSILDKIIEFLRQNNFTLDESHQHES